MHGVCLHIRHNPSSTVDRNDEDDQLVLKIKSLEEEHWNCELYFSTEWQYTRTLLAHTSAGFSTALTALFQSSSESSVRGVYILTTIFGAPTTLRQALKQIGTQRAQFEVD